MLLVLWRRADDIPGDAPLPWCYAVARRCLANHRRSAQRRLRLLSRLTDEVPLASTGGVVNGCGFSGEATPELEAAYAEAFPG